MGEANAGQKRIGGCAVAIMAKASTPGLAKTRLAPPLTFAEAAELNTAFLRDMSAKVMQAGAAQPIAPYVAYGPPGSEPFFRSLLPAEVALTPVWGPHFGECLWRTTSVLLEAGHDSACVLNSDSPTLPAAYLAEAARILAEPGDRAVLGPSTDGGYYILGLKQAHRHMFADIAWSTETVAQQTRERAREIGLALHELPAWYDVDDAQTLGLLLADVGLTRGRTREGADRAEATAALLRRLDDEAGLVRRLSGVGH